MKLPWALGGCPAVPCAAWIAAIRSSRRWTAAGTSSPHRTGPQRASSATSVAFRRLRQGLDLGLSLPAQPPAFARNSMPLRRLAFRPHPRPVDGQRAQTRHPEFAGHGHHRPNPRLTIGQVSVPGSVSLRAPRVRRNPSSEFNRTEQFQSPMPTRRRCPPAQLRWPPPATGSSGEVPRHFPCCNRCVRLRRASKSSFSSVSAGRRPATGERTAKPKACMEDVNREPRLRATPGRPHT